MTSSEKTFKGMQDDCVSLGHANEIVWISNPVIKSLFDSLFSNKKLFEDVIDTQNQSSTNGYITDKNDRIKKLVKRCYTMNRKLTLFAKQTNNQILLKDVDVSESNMLNKSETDLLLCCNLMLKRGREYLVNTEAYGVTENELNNLEEDIATIKQIPSEITVLTSEHKTATKSFKQVMAEARIILDQLDDAIEGMIDDKHFVDVWFDARKIKGRHNRKKPLDPTSDNDGTGNV